MDPVPGGNANPYVYVADPINFSDLSGLYACLLQCTVDVSVLQPSINSSRMQSSYEVTLRIRSVGTARSAGSPIRNALPNVATIANIDTSAPGLRYAPMGEVPRGGSNWISSLLPPGGYSPGGAAKAILLGCGTGAMALSAFGLGAAVFTEGVSIPAAALEGCTHGAETGALYYLLTGNGGEDNLDGSPMYDIQEYLHHL